MNLMTDYSGVCAVDTETSGLDARKCGTLSVAIVPLTNAFEPFPHYPVFVSDVRPDPGIVIEDKALQVNGFTPERMEAAPPRDETIKAFADWHAGLADLTKIPLITPLAHNFAFDKSFLTQWLDPNDMNTFFFYQHLDTMAMVNYYNFRSRIRGNKPVFFKTALTAVTKALGLQHDDAHGALGDAMATARLMRHFLTI